MELARVPNVPCGFESWISMSQTMAPSMLVPNVPCGVERDAWAYINSWVSRFLMYRVELKVKVNANEVERILLEFLMYRVELKAPIPTQAHY